MSPWGERYWAGERIDWTQHTPYYDEGYILYGKRGMRMKRKCAPRVNLEISPLICIKKKVIDGRFRLVKIFAQALEDSEDGGSRYYF
jgi:hypothetical protein